MPQTIQSVLDKLGTPPPEVALDWARQILHLPGPPEDVPVKVGDADEVVEGALAIDPNGAFDWQLFQVADSGEVALSAPPTDAADSASLTAFYLHHAKQLLKWGTVDYTNLPVDPNYRDLAKAIDAAIAQLGVQPESKQRDSGMDVASIADPIERPLPPKGSGPEEPGVKTSHSSNTTSNTPRGRYFVFIACSVVGLGLLGWLGWSFIVAPDSVNQANQGGPLSGFDTRTSSELASSQKQTGFEPSDDAARLALSTAPTAEADAVDDMQGNNAEIDAAAALADFRDRSNKSIDSGNQLASENDRTDENPPSNDSSKSAGSNQTTQSPDHAGLPDGPDGIADAMDVDVMAELGTLKQSLQQPNPEDSTTSIAVTPSEGLKLPAVNIVTFPSMQTVKVDLPRDVRLREPQWELSLQFADGFRVTPTEPRTLTRTRPLFWKVTSSSEKESSVTLTVGARLMLGRSPTVRWQMMASSKEVSGVPLPLSVQYLSNAESMLANVRRRLEFGIASINQFYGQSPKEMRSTLTAQRKAAESQLELCERLFRFAVDTRRITGLMDGQFEAHGKLLDVARSQSTIIATFGEPATITTDK